MSLPKEMGARHAARRCRCSWRGTLTRFSW